jgi:uncharacterized RDD family membrane protein YckC
LRPAGLAARCHAFLIDGLIKLGIIYVLAILAAFAGCMNRCLVEKGARATCRRRAHRGALPPGL